MAYIEDIVIATETIEDDLMRIGEVFECLREASLDAPNWMPPRNKKELQSFLGFANYYREFILLHACTDLH